MAWARSGINLTIDSLGVSIIGPAVVSPTGICIERSEADAFAMPAGASVGLGWARISRRLVCGLRLWPG